jgi:hypothetical protein
MVQGDESIPSHVGSNVKSCLIFGENMRILNSKRRKAIFSKKIAIFLLLTYFAMGAGLVDASVLCLGKDGHLAMETAVSCAFCGVRAILPVPPESLIPEGGAAPGCGPCQDFSITSAREFPGIALLSPPGSARSDLALSSMEPAEGSRTTIAFASSLSGPSGVPDPIPLHARTVVLLI